MPTTPHADAPPDRSIRLGLSRDMATLLLGDFREAIAHFARHPVTVSMTREEAGGFSHL